MDLKDLFAGEEEKPKESVVENPTDSSPGVITDSEQSELEPLRVKMIEALGDRNETDIPVHPNQPEDPYWIARRNFQLAYAKSLES